MSPAGPALAVTGSNLTGDLAFSAALSVAGRIVERHSEPGERGELATLVQQLCAEHGVHAADLRELRVDVGPGSYTGLRVAVTFVRFLMAFGPVQAFAVDSLMLLAARADGAGGRRVRPVLDARRGRLHVGCYRSEGARLVAVSPPAALPRAEALASLAADDVVVLPHALAPALSAELPPGVDVVEARLLTAAELFDARLATAAVDAAGLEPRYLMASYAED